MAKVTMPQLGESVAEGTIGKWLKQPGDHVDKYEPLLEVITDKVNAEVPSPFEGVLKEILAEEGATVANNAEIAVIETADEGASTGGASTGGTSTDGASTDGNGTSASAPASAAASQPTDAKSPGDAPKAASDDPVPVETIGPAGSDESAAKAPAPAAAATTPPPTATQAPGAQGDPDARMTPAVRRLLREHALSPEQIVGTGGGGRITRDDVLAVVEAIRTGGAVPVPVMAKGAPPTAASQGATPAPAEAQAPATPPASRPTGAPVEFPEGADEVLLPMTQMRKGIAAQMTRALQAPHAYVQMEVDATRLVAAREGAKRTYQAKEGISLSYVPFVVKAAAESLKRNPTFNANWTDQGLLAKRRINIGVAVAVDDGLLVPVIRDADTLSIHGLNVAITDVANRARANKLRLDDFGGGTFTVDNTGYLGTNLVMPILNVPEVGIVTMEAITKRPVVRSTPDGDVIAIRPVMNMVLGVDHRANDGAGGAALLRDIKAWLEAVGPETPIY
ncbi:MAG TPA: dihydrolipoamide acetyltransferase family protein [Candidatus Limnocylindrales bacterium]|nr:dihydrolipoamide acetyltransferase family protein [Candidatus Limnocylindrales bacterium]